MGKPLEVIVVESWPELRALFEYRRFKSWAFRGQSDTAWPLLASLSRTLLKRGVQLQYWPLVEERILRIFKRKAHLFLDHAPDESDSFQWIALMQHHGAPTRLLDFTWSPYVAAFFALDSATCDAAIWALFPPRVSAHRTRTLRASQATDPGEIAPWIQGHYEKYFLKNDQRIVVIGEPHIMNKRLTAQSGTFVMPGVLETPIDELMVGDDEHERGVVKIVLRTQSLRARAMGELYAMNITNATLFPDLDGLARSLSFELESHWAFDPVTGEVYSGFYIE